MEAWVFSNIVVGSILDHRSSGGLAAVVRRSRMWSEAFSSLWRRRRVALSRAIGFYVLVALLDSVAVGGREQFGEDAVAKYQAQSILIDRAFARHGSASAATRRRWPASSSTVVRRWCIRVATCSAPT